ncbi:hypothetical protein CHCC5022_2660 [Bacillus paralicheniformis]|uniref:Uncharacterized protein n=1 Tax=Bacillus paralicheniformis TaxID=1648923 RepID=A0A7Z1B6L1_9BACI|nr:hypothetical protein B4121_0145 [Bacillus paralicheniformis]TWJ34033.1 hypothetical protein CHCC5027_3474 [Bacillus paralicheniformis]TWJ53730.1 hypothetical protein CHCC5022_2660 [Bacillus paralicheniformis]TWJ80751.1 hypothetical protein CHCC4186_4147 [Bacillus paralicheniformis]TWK36171.1 hypothetical protein CHCC20348_1378 [Bacillus paralicheniformis]
MIHQSMGAFDADGRKLPENVTVFKQLQRLFFRLKRLLPA